MPCKPTLSQEHSRRLCVNKMQSIGIEDTILVGNGIGGTVFILRIQLIPTDLPFTFKRLLLPETFNTEKVTEGGFGVDLRASRFSHARL